MSDIDLIQIVLILKLSFLVACISFTVTKTKIFKWLRDIPFVNWTGLLHCGYCFSHWVALPFVIYEQLGIYNYFVIVWFAGCMWFVLCLILKLIEMFEEEK